MGKVLDKIKEFVFGKKLIEDKIEDACKAKNVSDTEKFKTCVDLMGEYLLTEHYNRATYETWETYYETFFVNDKKDVQKYNKCFEFMSDNILMINSVRLEGNVNDLKNVETDKLTEKEKLIYNKIKECTKMYFPENFDYKHYVLQPDNYEAFEKISKNILDDIIVNYKEKNNLDDCKINAVEEFGQSL